MIEITNIIVYLGFSLFLLVGIILACLPFFQRLHRRMSIYSRYKEIQMREDNTILTKYFNRLFLLAETTFAINKKENTYLLIVGSFFIAVFTALVLYTVGSNIFIIICISFLLGAIPYLLLLLRLQKLRFAGSNEVELLIVELLSQYRINHFNMYEAIDQTIPRLTSAPYLQKALIRLSFAIKQADSDAVIISSVDNFNYALKTNWSAILSENLKYSLVYGENVYQSLEDILEESKTMNSIYEKDRQQNNEALFMIKYVTPAVYLFSVYAMVAIIGFDFSKYVDYQFYNTIGLKFFALILIFMIINSGIYILIKKRKRDF
jgi:hypothetical protein